MDREEAIEVLKKKAEYLESDKRFKAAVETLIPELKESEDERIRRWLVDYFKSVGNSWIHRDISPEQILAYLEKQKEQKPILEVFGFKVGDAVRLKDGDGRKHIIKSFEEVEGLHGPNFYHVEFEDNSARDGIYPGEEYPNGYYTQMEKFEKEQKSAEWDRLQEVFRSINEAFEDGKKEVVAHPKKYGLCEPTEWSKEDEDKLYQIIETLLADKEVARQENPQHYDVLSKAYDELISWLKSLPLNLKKKNEDVAKLCSNEWSEEDEKIAKEIEEELWYPGDFPDYPSKEESELYDDCQRRLDWFKNKLKSLRPQPKQEWSEDKNKLDKIHSTVQRFIKTIK